MSEVNPVQDPPPPDLDVCINGPDVIWINGKSVKLNSTEEGKWLIKLLLDNGVKVTGYWRDLDYSGTDPRIGMGSIR